MTGLIITIHVVICILLIAMILIQRGRGGGLVDTLSDVESMFGTKTNAFLTRTTTVLSVLFFITCLSLAFISAKASRSLMRGQKIKEGPTQKETLPQESASLPAGTNSTKQEEPLKAN